MSLKMTSAEKQVDELLRSMGLLPARYTTADMAALSKRRGQSARTPDFKVRTSGGGGFYCEVVTLDKTSDEETIRWNRIPSKIHKAAAQFDSVNSVRIVPNVLVWVCSEWRVHCTDIPLVLTGQALMSDGSIIGGFERLSNGQIARDKHKIDLHLWIDHLGGTHTIFVDDPSRPEHGRNLRRYFGPLLQRMMEHNQLQRHRSLPRTFHGNAGA